MFTWLADHSNAEGISFIKERQKLSSLIAKKRRLVFAKISVNSENILPLSQ
jgi:hypothetical protein